MHETSNYYFYIHLCNFESNTSVYLYIIISAIYITLYKILLKYIYMYKKIINLNANNNLIKINYIYYKIL